MTEGRSGRDLRRHRRQNLDGRVRIAWQDGQGEMRTCEVACLDISTSGLSITVPEQIPVRSIVHLRGIGSTLDSSGSVRYCRRQGMAYLLGIEFSGGFQFTPGEKKRRWD